MDVTHNLICEIKPYIQPFERVLALKELRALAGAEPTPIKHTEPSVATSYRVTTDLPVELFVERLTYWEFVSLEGAQENRRTTRQVRLEATNMMVRNGISPQTLRELILPETELNLPNRRVLRYGSHGLHEYRGKFFPQLVRSLLNISGIPARATVLDPMCGSGTAPVEAVVTGRDSVGIDLNPLSVFMSQVKCDILRVDPELLINEFELLKADLLSSRPSQSGTLPWYDNLPSVDRRHLAGWFSSEVLRDLDTVMHRIQRTRCETCRNLFLLSLSNILRRVSWQKNDDLRVRKEIRTDEDVDVLQAYLDELNRSVRTVVAFLYENAGFPVGKANIIEGNVLNADQFLAAFEGKIDVIITSPPYATALPYLDTDRLNLSYLNLLERSKHRTRDYEMIGNREINSGRREFFWHQYQSQKRDLPSTITNTIDLIDQLNRDANVGFRRRNLPPLLYRYFMDMKEVFAKFMILLRPGAPAYVVIGNNHTVAGGKRIDIETNHMLGELAQSVGLRLEDVLPMEMLVSRDLFKKNASSEETILFLRKA